MAVCCCSCRVHFTLMAHQLLARWWADSTDSSLVYTTPNFNFSLHQVCVIYFMHVTLISIISFIIRGTSEPLLKDDHSARPLWSDTVQSSLSHAATSHNMVRPAVLLTVSAWPFWTELLSNMILNQCHLCKLLCCIHYITVGYLEVQVRTLCHLMLLLLKPGGCERCPALDSLRVPFLQELKQNSQRSDLYQGVFISDISPEK